MFDFLSYIPVDAVIGVVAFAAGVILSQKVKDKLAGVPSEVRAAVSSFEASAQAAVTNAKNDALAKIKASIPGGTVLKAAAPSAAAPGLQPDPVVKVAPAAAPAPAPAPAAQATPAQQPVA